MAQLEVACFSEASALIAYDAGADRIEYCASAELGGITPNLYSLTNIKDGMDSRRSIPIFVMIRPRGGNFVYNAMEFQQMCSDLTYCRDHHLADGFVFGILDDLGNIDGERNQHLVELANGSPCTFHRAFDVCTDSHEALEDVIRCGFSALLTSGGKANAQEGVQVIGLLVQQAGDRITIMPGGGVRSSNIIDLAKQTQAQWFHSAAILRTQDQANAEEIQNMKRLLQETDVKV